MLPQRVKEEGGYTKKGKTDGETQALLEGAFRSSEGRSLLP